MSNLAELARKFGCSLLTSSIVQPKGVAISSKFVEKDFLFVAIQGEKNHGLDFLDDAIAKGATCLLTDVAGSYPIPTLVHPEPRKVAGLIAAEVFQTPNTGLFAVTGTNGKTSTAYYLQRLLMAMGQQAGLISSAGQIVGDEQLVSELTTPESPRIHHLLSKMRSKGQQLASLEVSAQALSRNRVDGLRFHVAGFTNLSRDHLDDYGDMDTYLRAKATLFTEKFSDLAVINVEDQWGEKLYSNVSIPKVGIGSGLEYQFAYANGQLSISGKQQIEVDFALGQLMAKNLALALVMLMEYGFFPDELEPAVEKIDQQVPGRLHLVSSLKPHVYLDYAHTPAGVEAAVAEIRSRYEFLTVVLGASGNRDKGKREEMGLACKGASRIVITDQHPRDEDPAQIRKALIDAASSLGVEVIERADPEEAIKTAVHLSPRDGAVLWCGPGQLSYREIRGVKVPFNAIQIARMVVEDD